LVFDFRSFFEIYPEFPVRTLETVGWESGELLG